MLALNLWAGESDDQVVKVLKSSTEKTSITVSEDTFVFNINGYGCQWPGIKILNIVAEPDLNHNKPFAHFGSDANYMAIGIKDPAHQFCHTFGDAQTVFGKEFVTNTELPITITRVLDLRNGKRLSNEGHMKSVKLIHETINIGINGRIVESTSEIILNNK